MSSIIEFLKNYPPEYYRDIVLYIIVFVVLGAISWLYFDFKESRAEKKLYKLYHQHLEDEKREK